MVFLFSLTEFLMPQLWTANISSRDGGKDSKIDLSLSGCRLLKWVEILVHIISLQLGHDISRLVHGDLPELFAAALFVGQT